jgi:hypothetical protein
MAIMDLRSSGLMSHKEPKDGKSAGNPHHAPPEMPQNRARANGGTWIVHRRHSNEKLSSSPLYALPRPSSDILCHA